MRMLRNLVAGALMLFAAGAVAAQNQQCVCTTGCKIAVWNNNWAALGTQNAPTACTIKKGGSSIGTAPAVAGAALSNSGVCFPADSQTTPIGPMCIVSIPAQSSGTVTLAATATFAAGESAESPPFVFVSVVALPVVGAAPNQQRVTQ